MPGNGPGQAATLEQLDAVVDDFGNAATAAVEAGFDAIEIHMGHGYLLSSFFSPNLNKRSDRCWRHDGSSRELARRVAERVRLNVGDSVAVTAKFNMDDGVRRFWLTDSLPTAQLLEADGYLHALQLTGGSSLLNPMYYFRGNVPLDEFIASQPRPVGLGLRIVGRRMFRTISLRRGLFPPLARQFREALSMPLMLLGGINRLDGRIRPRRGLPTTSPWRGHCCGSVSNQQFSG